MNNEQNIDDILRLLKDAFDENEKKAETDDIEAFVPDGKKKAPEMTADKVQKKLREQYMPHDSVADSTAGGGEYFIDEDLFGVMTAEEAPENKEPAEESDPVEESVAEEGSEPAEDETASEGDFTEYAGEGEKLSFADDSANSDNDLTYISDATVEDDDIAPWEEACDIPSDTGEKISVENDGLPESEAQIPEDTSDTEEKSTENKSGSDVIIPDDEEETVINSYGEDNAPSADLTDETGNIIMSPSGFSAESTYMDIAEDDESEEQTTESYAIPDSDESFSDMMAEDRAAYNDNVTLNIPESGSSAETAPDNGADISEDIYDIFRDTAGFPENPDNSGKPEDAHDSSIAADTIPENNPEAAEDAGYESAPEITENAGMPDDSSVKKGSIDDSVINLMLQMGYENELEKAVGTERVNQFRQEEADAEADAVDINEAFAYRGEEFSADSEEQTEKIRYEYKRERTFLLLRLISTGAVAFIILLYELLPRLGVRFTGLFDYSEVPAAYLMIDIQLILIAAVLSFRKMLNGLKQSLTSGADSCSLISLGVIFTVIYDIILIVSAPTEFPPMFGTAIVMYIFAALVTDYMNISREISSFAVYSSDGRKYTLSDDRSEGSAADKMYSSGLDPECHVFSIKRVSSVNRYFGATNRKINDASVSYAVTPIAIFSIAAAVASVILEKSFGESAGIFMSAFLAAVPVSALVSHCLPMFISSQRLKDRGCAVASEAMAQRYAECDLIVFSDMHLFRASNASDNGVIIYEKGKVRELFVCLDALFESIGGPMKTVFSKASDGRRHSVRPVRITRNGIEAVIDDRSYIIVGAESYFDKYGIKFTGGGQKANENLLYVALNSKAAAKIRVSYQTEPLFERICEALAANGISCAIETYDPVINGSFVAHSRTFGKSPVSVVHKNTEDWSRGEKRTDFSDTGIVACSSRLKLAELAVWCKRIARISKICSAVRVVFYILTIVAVSALVAFDIAEVVNQYWILLYQLLWCLPAVIVSLKLLPGKKEFDLSRVQPAQSVTEQKKNKKKKSKDK